MTRRILSIVLLLVVVGAIAQRLGVFGDSTSTARGLSTTEKAEAVAALGRLDPPAGFQPQQPCPFAPGACFHSSDLVTPFSRVGAVRLVRRLGLKQPTVALDLPLGCTPGRYAIPGRPRTQVLSCHGVARLGRFEVLFFVDSLGSDSASMAKAEGTNIHLSVIRAGS